MFANKEVEMLDKETQIYLAIKRSGTHQLYDIEFNYFYYSALFHYKTAEFTNYVLNALIYFIYKEINITYKVASVNEVYASLSFMKEEDLYDICAGRESVFILLKNDAMKMGALLALHYRITKIGKSQLLEIANDLLLSKNVV